MSALTRCLLDKVTARRTAEGLLKTAEGRPLTDDEVFALDLYQRAPVVYCAADSKRVTAPGETTSLFAYCPPLP